MHAIFDIKGIGGIVAALLAGGFAACYYRMWRWIFHGKKGEKGEPE